LLQWKKFLVAIHELELLSGLRRENSDILLAVGEFLELHTGTDFTGNDVDRFDEIIAVEATVTISEKKLQDIRAKKLSADQIDEVMDEADRRIAESKRVRRLKREDGNQTTPATETSREAGGKNAEEVSLSEYIEAVNFFGRVIRNSEFNDAAVKVKFTKKYLRCVELIFGVLVYLIREVVTAYRARIAKNLSDDDAKALNLFLVRLVLLAIQSLMAENFGSEKNSAVYDIVMKERGESKMELVLLPMLGFDMHLGGWREKWTKAADELTPNRFVLATFIEKLWIVIHSRVIDDNVREDVKAVADHFERLLGAKRHQRSQIVKTIGERMGETKRRDET